MRGTIDPQRDESRPEHIANQIARHPRNQIVQGLEELLWSSNCNLLDCSTPRRQPRTNDSTILGRVRNAPHQSSCYRWNQLPSGQPSGTSFSLDDEISEQSVQDNGNALNSSLLSRARISPQIEDAPSRNVDSITRHS